MPRCLPGSFIGVVVAQLTILLPVSAAYSSAAAAAAAVAATTYTHCTHIYLLLFSALFATTAASERKLFADVRLLTLRSCHQRVTELTYSQLPFMLVGANVNQSGCEAMCKACTLRMNISVCVCVYV